MIFSANLVILTDEIFNENLIFCTVKGVRKDFVFDLIFNK